MTTIAQNDVQCGSLSYRTDVRWLDVRFPDGKGWTVCADTRLRPWDWILQRAGDHHPPIATGMTHQECRRVAVMTEAQAEAWAAQRAKAREEARTEPGTWVAWDDVPHNTIVRVRGESDEAGHKHDRAYAAVRFGDRGKWVLASGHQSQGDCDLALDNYLRLCWEWSGAPDDMYHTRVMILGPARGTHLASLAAQAQVAILSELLVDRWVAGLT